MGSARHGAYSAGLLHLSSLVAGAQTWNYTMVHWQSLRLPNQKKKKKKKSALKRLQLLHAFKK